MNKLKIGLLALTLLLATPLGLQKVNTNFTPDLREVNCLAQNIYHEARGEPIEGQLAVAQVTINRVRIGSWGSSVCKVVYAPSQFSWTLNKHKQIKNTQSWNTSVAIANEVLSGRAHLANFNALYFHTRQVRPKWRRGKQKVTTIGNHIFYT
jgi:spore germination cell wall hydrolase CwlJ-like protein